MHHLNFLNFRVIGKRLLKYVSGFSFMHSFWFYENIDYKIINGIDL